MNLYKNLGFKEVGVITNFIKDNGRYYEYVVRGEIGLNSFIILTIIFFSHFSLAKFFI
nr:hypothetical protein [Myroides sp. N17-2]